MRQSFSILILLTAGFFPAVPVFAKDFKGAEYRTKEAFLYGRFEIRMKATPAEGVLSTFFTYFDGTTEDPWTSAKWNEIDIEIVGRYRNSVQFNTITPNQNNHVSSVFTSFDPAADFHTYAIEWTPTYVSWYIDDVMVRKQTASHVLTLTRAQKLMMNTWNPAYPDWVGTFSAASLPAFSWYDWIKVYAYTPGTGTTGEGNNFSFLWEDPFDSFDETRWEKGTHTWNGNNSDFITENVTFQNGYLVLSLTNPTVTGYRDTAAPSVLELTQQDTVITVRFSEWVTKATAETKGNYLISGLTVKSATLHPIDQSIVTLVTTKPDPAKTYNVIFQNVTDRFSPPNKMSLTNKQAVKTTGNLFPLKIDVGSNKASNGFLADRNYSFTQPFGYADGRQRAYTNAIGNTELDSVYQTDQSGIILYRVKVPAGKYHVTLMAAEKVLQARNQRVFDVTVESADFKETDIDLYDRVGFSKAWTHTFNNVPVTDGVLDIHFSANRGEAILSGLQIDYAGTLTSVDDKTGNPGTPILYGNYPNPFNPTTMIRYQISEFSQVTLQVYDVTGRLIDTLADGWQAAGVYNLPFTSSGLASGVYFYRLQSGTFTAVKPMLLIK